MFHGLRVGIAVLDYRDGLTPQGVLKTVADKTRHIFFHQNRVHAHGLQQIDGIIFYFCQCVLPTEDFMGAEYQPWEKQVLRWFILFRYPRHVDRTEGERWFLHVHVPEVMKQPGLYRFFSFQVIRERLPLPGAWAPGKNPPPQNVLHPWDRLIELWYETFDDWQHLIRVEAILATEAHRHYPVCISDGADAVRDLQLYMNPNAEHILDWFHITIQLTEMRQMAKGLGPQGFESREHSLKQLERIKWFLWHGNTFRASQTVSWLPMDIDADDPKFQHCWVEQCQWCLVSALKQ